MNMSHRWFLVGFVLLTAGGVSMGGEAPQSPGQHPQSLNKEVIIRVEMDYLLYLPDDYEASDQSWPLILFLHGAGERGEDLEMVKIHGPPKMVAQEGKSFYPEAAHDSWTETYNNPELYEWFLQHKRGQKPPPATSDR